MRNVVCMMMKRNCKDRQKKERQDQDGYPSPAIAEAIGGHTSQGSHNLFKYVCYDRSMSTYIISTRLLYEAIGYAAGIAVLSYKEGREAFEKAKGNLICSCQNSCK